MEEVEWNSCELEAMKIVLSCFNECRFSVCSYDLERLEETDGETQSTLINRKRGFSNQTRLSYSLGSS